MTRIQYTTTVQVKDKTFTIDSVEALQYNGEWMHLHFDVHLDGSYHTTFFGYPTKSNIINAYKGILFDE